MTWRDDPKVLSWVVSAAPKRALEDAVAARDREVAGTLRAKIEALQDGLRFGDVRREAVLAVLDAVLGGDS